MNANQLKQIDDLTTPDNPAFAAFETRFGEIWSSAHSLSADISYQTQLPCGLHIGAGCALLETSSRSLGRVSQNGASFNLIQCPDGYDEIFSSSIGQGSGFSGGIYIPFKTDPSNDELNQLLEKLPAQTPAMYSARVPYHIVQRLCAPLDCWYQGAARDLAMEARAYEYLAVALSVMQGEPQTIGPKPKRYVLRAKEIIDADIMNIPNLAELARRVGINPRFLSHSFRQTFGCSVHDYVAERRMQQAIVLLENGISVSETAHSVGYSLGHFCEKFHRHYGFTAGSVSTSNKSPVF